MKASRTVVLIVLYTTHYTTKDKSKQTNSKITNDANKINFNNNESASLNRLANKAYHQCHQMLENKPTHKPQF